MATGKPSTSVNRNMSNEKSSHVNIGKGIEMTEKEMSMQELADQFNQEFKTAVAAKNAKSSKDTKQAEKAVKAATETKSTNTNKFMVAQYGQEGSDRQVVMIPMIDLFPLDGTGINSCKEAMRELNKENLFNLRMAYRETPDRIPPIRVVYSTWNKFIPFDGNHRWTAQAQNLMEDLGLDPESKESINNAAYKKALRETLIPVEVTNTVNGHPVSNRDLIQMAFTANFKHGLPVSAYGRTRYAIWLLRDAAERGEPMKQVEACRIAGVKKSSLSQQLARERDRLEKKQKQPVDLTFLGEEDNRELDDFVDHADVKEAEDKIGQATKRVINTAKTLRDLFSEPGDLHAFMVGYVKDMHASEAMSFLYEALSFGFEWADEENFAESTAE